MAKKPVAIRVPGFVIGPAVEVRFSVTFDYDPEAIQRSRAYQDPGGMRKKNAGACRRTDFPFSDSNSCSFGIRRKSQRQLLRGPSRNRSARPHSGGGGCAGVEIARLQSFDTQGLSQSLAKVLPPSRWGCECVGIPPKQEPEFALTRRIPLFVSLRNRYI